MPLIIFTIMYITGSMLSFARRSNIRGYQLNTFVRFMIFMKPGKGTVFMHALIFQGLNVIIFGAIVVLYFILDESEMVTVYNIYKWISLILFTSVILITAIDAAVLERNGKGRNDENN